MGRSLKAQLKYAGKIGARYAAIIGDNELQNSVAVVRDMVKSEENTVPMTELHQFIKDGLL
jgi:histidyl-tRNA synthetase